MNNATIEVKSRTLQDADEGTTLFTRGSYHKKKDVHFIFYDMADTENPADIVKHKLQVYPDYVKISYSGSLNQSFVLKKGMRCESVYVTPYGEFEFVFCGKKQSMTEKNGSWILFLQYEILSGGSLMAEQELQITVTPDAE